MSSDIRITGTELQWRSEAGNTFSTQGVAISGSGQNRSIRISNSNDLEYIDENGQARRCVSNQDGTENIAQPRSLYIFGPDLRYIGHPPGELDPRPVFVVVDGQAPTEVPTNLVITTPVQAVFHPWDARVEWTNTSSEWQVRVRWFRNGTQVQTALLPANSTVHTTDDEYFDIGDEIQVQVSYENDFGNGDPATEFETA